MKILFNANTPAPLARTVSFALVALSSNHCPTQRRIAVRIATAVDFVQTGHIAKLDVATL